MPRNAVIRALPTLALFTTLLSAFTLASSSTPAYSEDAIAVPTGMYNVEEIKFTAAPELKRQATTNYCTGWSFVNGT